MDAQPWYLRHAPKAIGVITSIVCFICGITTMISITVSCIISGILLILISIVVMTAEAPLCCAMVPQLNRVSVLGEKLSSLQRLIFYAIATILPISLCFGISTIFTTLVLGGSCAFYVWRFILERRARRAGDPSGIVIGSGPPPPMTSEGAHIQQASHGTSGGAFGDQLMQNAATGAFKGAIGTAPYPTGNYPGF
ncbi:hypothetical protein CRM22_010391 [Opisthorchis felineus]|uniref:Calcium channel flower n=2 Tax=Opisthorchis felineus TaxID=147828 RepID=A0A4S2KZ93_OPIFE|nr:hypothetical protein CRM22_010391 [Opisthorchis felineus]